MNKAKIYLSYLAITLIILMISGTCVNYIISAMGTSSVVIKHMMFANGVNQTDAVEIERFVTQNDFWDKYYLFKEKNGYLAFQVRDIIMSVIVMGSLILWIKSNELKWVVMTCVFSILSMSIACSQLSNDTNRIVIMDKIVFSLIGSIVWYGIIASFMIFYGFLKRNLKANNLPNKNDAPEAASPPR